MTPGRLEEIEKELEEGICKPERIIEELVKEIKELKKEIESLQDEVKYLEQKLKDWEGEPYGF